MSLTGKYNKSTIKSKFETGDKPSGKDFADFIDSVPNFIEDNPVLSINGIKADPETGNLTLNLNEPQPPIETPVQKGVFWAVPVQFEFSQSAVTVQASQPIINEVARNAAAATLPYELPAAGLQKYIALVLDFSAPENPFYKILSGVAVEKDAFTPALSGSEKFISFKLIDASGPVAQPFQVKLYSTTGNNTDGAMTQKAASEKFALKGDFPSGGGSWGSITGSISSQSDLMALLRQHKDIYTLNDPFILEVTLSNSDVSETIVKIVKSASMSGVEYSKNGGGWVSVPTTGIVNILKSPSDKVVLKPIYAAGQNTGTINIYLTETA